MKGIDSEHVNSGLNYAYFSDLDEFILDHPQIHTWIYGHTHRQAMDKIGNTTLRTNARGYNFERCARDFNPDTSFEI
jgi:hypothetical protein